MESALRILHLNRKKDPSHNSLKGSMGHLVSASLETLGIAAPSNNAPKRADAPAPTKQIDQSVGSTGSLSSHIDSSSTVQSSGSSFVRTGSLSSQSSSASSSKHVSKPRTSQQITTGKATFDFSAEIFANLRGEPVSKLTGRVKDISTRPVFEGAYSNVWNGTLDRSQKVAIKCLRDQPIREEKAKRRLRREVGTWWCLEHENIVPLLGTVYDDKFGTSPAMISPWYENGTAQDYLGPNKSVSMSQRVKLFHDVAKGLLYLHTFDVTKITVNSEPCGIKLIHGDLKPLNVLVDDNGVAKLCDFGLLRLVREHAPTGMTTTSSHTGTVRYLCYEMVSDNPDETKPTTASDVYALACIGMQFIYSKPPHADISDRGAHPEFKIMRAIEEGKPPALRPRSCTGIISGLWDLFEACWSTKPSKRPNAAAVCQFLEENRMELIAELDK